MVIPANTDSSISAESSLASLGTRIGRSTLSMLVTTMTWKTMTKMPPQMLPKIARPIPNGMVTMPPPSGITDSADSRMAKMKNPSWKPAM